MKKKLAESLGIPETRGVTAIVGGGGKTSLMFRLAEELADDGKTAVVSTTTKIYIPDRPGVLLLDGSGDLPQPAGEGRILCIGRPGEDGKLRFPGDEVFARACRLADRVIVEADGARHCPVKAPGEHEPVIPAGTDSLVAVAGLDALGRKISDVSFRSELVCQVLDACPEDVLTPEMLARLLTSPQGQRKALPDGACFSVVLNKADDAGLQAAARETAELIQSLCPGCRVAVTALEQRECLKALYI